MCILILTGVVTRIHGGLPLWVLIMMAGGLVNWISKLQSIATVSSTEAEYLACYDIQNFVWIRQLLKDIVLPYNYCLTLKMFSKESP